MEEGFEVFQKHMKVKLYTEWNEWAEMRHKLNMQYHNKPDLKG